MAISKNAKRNLHIASIGLAFGVILLALTGLFIQIIYFRQRLRAENLLNEVRSLEVGQSSVEDIVRIAAEHNGGEAQISGFACDPHGPSYTVAIANDTLNNLPRTHALFRYVLHPRTVTALFILKNGRLCYVEYSVETEPYNTPRPVRRNASVTLASETQHLPFDVRFVGGNIPTFRVALTTEATPEQHRHAFDFNLSCLASFSGCREACEVMPTAWLDYQNKARREGRTPPFDELNDSHCANLRAGENLAPE